MAPFASHKLVFTLGRRSGVAVNFHLYEHTGVMPMVAAHYSANIDANTAPPAAGIHGHRSLLLLILLTALGRHCWHQALLQLQ